MGHWHDKIWRAGSNPARGRREVGAAYRLKHLSRCDDGSDRRRPEAGKSSCECPSQWQQNDKLGAAEAYGTRPHRDTLPAVAQKQQWTMGDGHGQWEMGNGSWHCRTQRTPGRRIGAGNILYLTLFTRWNARHNFMLAALAAVSRLLAQGQGDWTKAFGRARCVQRVSAQQQDGRCISAGSRVSQWAQQASVWRWRSWPILFSSSSPNRRLVLSLARSSSFYPNGHAHRSLSLFVVVYQTAVS